MAWDSLFSGGSTQKTASGWGGLFDTSVTQAEVDRKKKERDLQAQAQIAERESAQANSFSGIAKNTAVDFGHKLLQVPVDFVKNTFATYQQTIPKVQSTVTQAVEEVKSAIKKPSINTPAEVTSAVAKGTLRNAGDIVTAVFAPISGAIGAVLKASGGQSLIDSAGNIVADKSGITDLPAFQRFATAHPNAGEDFNRLLNLVMAGAAGDKVNPAEVQAKSEVLAQKLVEPSTDGVSGMRRIPVQGDSVETRIPNNNAYTAPQDLPVIDMGAKPKGEAIPTIQADTNPSGTGSYSYEPVAQPKSAWDTVFSKDTQTTTATVKPTTDTTTSTQASAKPVEVANAPTAEATPVSDTQAVNTRAQKLLQAAVEKKLVSDYGDLPTHDRLNMSEQAAKAVDFVSRDEAVAKDVAMGRTLPPGGVLAEAVYAALETKAIREGDVKLITELSQSKVPTAAGQGLKALDSIDPNSPVKILRDINTSRMKKVEKRSGTDAKTKEVSTIKKEVNTAVSKTKWDDFIKEITCGY